MVDSPHHPEEEVIFALGRSRHVVDPEEAEKKTKKTTKKAITKKSNYQKEQKSLR